MSSGISVVLTDARDEAMTVSVTRRQAVLMANAMWAMEKRVRLYAEIAGIDYHPVVKEDMALAELRRRLHLAGMEVPR